MNFRFVISFFIAVFSFQTVTFAQLAPDFGAPGKHKGRISFKLAGDAFHESDESYVSDQNEVFFYLPVYQNENSTYAATAKSYNLSFSNLVSSSDFVPVNDLHSVQYGFAWAKEDTDKNTWGLAGNYGSASDKPFDSADVSSFDLTLTRKISKTATSSWIYFLNYSNNRTFLNNIPLPGFAYTFMEEDKTSGGVIGLPFVSYWWRPTDRVFASVLYLIPARLNLQAGYMLWGPFQANAKLEHGQQTFFRSGRAEKKEQIYYETSRAALSLKTFLGKDTFFDLEYARIFNRSLYDGTSAFEATSDRLRMPNEWQVTLSGQVAF